MSKEIWKSIPNYENYEGSSLGRIRRSKPGKGAIVGSIIKGSKNNKGYLRHGGHFIHRLIAITFIPNPENLPEVNHLNGIKNDNRLKNLEWSTTSENCKHAHKTGLRKATQGENHFRTKFNESQILEIVKL